MHAVLELVLIVALRSLRLDVLLDRIDLRLVLNQFLLDIVQPVVNLVLQDLVFHFVVIHRLVSDLLGQAILVHLQKLFDLAHAQLFLVELGFEVVCPGEFVFNVVLHAHDFVLSLFHFFFDSLLEVLDFLQVIIALLLLDPKPGCSGLAVLHLALLELEVAFHILHLLRGWKFVLSLHGSLHVLHKLGNVELVVLDNFVKTLLFDLELRLKFIDLFLLLVENLILLLIARATLVLHVAVDFSEIILVSFNHLLHLVGILFQLF